MKTDSLTKLGSENTLYSYDDPSLEMLETFDNTAEDTLVPFVCNEFTSLCPKTGQPDFARVEILYVPRKTCIESKSLKMYLFAFRNHGAFHEDCIAKIGTDVIEKIDPFYVRVFGDFNVRGGISIKPLFEYWFVGLQDPTSFDRAGIESKLSSYDRLRHWD